MTLETQVDTRQLKTMANKKEAPKKDVDLSIDDGDRFKKPKPGKSPEQLRKDFDEAMKNRTKPTK